jgi:hypothetical protein
MPVPITIISFHVIRRDVKCGCDEAENPDRSSKSAGGGLPGVKVGREEEEGGIGGLILYFSLDLSVVMLVVGINHGFVRIVGASTRNVFDETLGT